MYFCHGFELVPRQLQGWETSMQPLPQAALLHMHVGDPVLPLTRLSAPSRTWGWQHAGRLSSTPLPFFLGKKEQRAEMGISSVSGTWTKAATSKTPKVHFRGFFAYSSICYVWIDTKGATASVAFWQQLEISPCRAASPSTARSSGSCPPWGGQGGLRAQDSKVPPGLQGLDTSPPHSP